MGRALTPWNEGFDHLRRRMDRLLEDFVHGDGNERERWMPSVDVMEDKESFLLRADVPGLSKENIKITLQDNVLTISGEKKQERDQKERSYHLTERTYGQFSRTFTLPSKVEQNNITAEFKDGVLEIHLPKSPEAKAKEIQVQMK
jgi:HSP20 family protein